MCLRFKYTALVQGHNCADSSTRLSVKQRTFFSFFPYPCKHVALVAVLPRRTYTLTPFRGAADGAGEALKEEAHEITAEFVVRLAYRLKHRSFGRRTRDKRWSLIDSRRWPRWPRRVMRPRPTLSLSLSSMSFCLRFRDKSFLVPRFPSSSLTFPLFFFPGGFRLPLPPDLTISFLSPWRPQLPLLRPSSSPLLSPLSPRCSSFFFPAPRSIYLLRSGFSVSHLFSHFPLLDPSLFLSLSFRVWPPLFAPIRLPTAGLGNVF